MHSDEGWLASLSRSISIEKNIGTSENFFHEVERSPHAIKSLFHLLQIPFLKIGFNLFTLRLLSFIAGITTLYFLFLTSATIFHDKLIAFVFILLLALDIQFIYISHFARQEILILMIFSICLYIFVKPNKKWKIKKDIFIGTILGVSIGLHPNIFIITTGFIFLYLLYSVFRIISSNHKYPSAFNLVTFLLILALFGIFYIGLSIKINPDFLTGYIKFGEGVGVTKPFIIKVLKLPRFYKKMFYQIGGTYYLPDIRPQLISFAVSFFLLIPAAIFISKGRVLILTFQALILGITTGILIIGKYSPPSIIFLFVPGYLLIFILLKRLPFSRKNLIVTTLILAAFSVAFSIKQIVPWMNSDYNKYIHKIEANIPSNTKTLANLNSIFAFSDGQLYSFRDLTSLNSNFRFNDYIKKYNIEYIVYSNELEIIYKERPVWNTMYGNIYPWYEDMMEFIKTDCKIIGTWSEPVFGMRITSYMGKYGGNISIYKVINKE